jgi:ParB family transcriptional regulator, chromosome partitioning protein
VNHQPKQQSVPNGQYRHRPNHPHPGERQKAKGESPTLTQQAPVTGHQSRPPHVRLIPLEQIVPNPHQPRREFDEPALQELADSIRQHGILQPLLVRQRGNERFELIAGERRHRAAKIAGLTHVPAIVQKFSDREQAEISLIENLQREDLSPVETARAFRTLINQFGMTQKQIGERVGKTQSAISNLLRLLQLPEAILDSLDRGELQEGHARALLSIEDDTLRSHLSQQVIAHQLSVRQTEALVKSGKASRTESEQTVSKAVRLPSAESVSCAGIKTLFAEQYEQALQERLAEKFATEVRIRHLDAVEGQIELGFSGNANLLRITDILLDSPE